MPLMRTGNKVIVPMWGAGRIGINRLTAEFVRRVGESMRKELIVRGILSTTSVPDTVQREEHV